MNLVEQNIIVVVGDLGSGINFVKNTILLSPEVDFPNVSGSRLSTICNLVYPSALKHQKDHWVNYEYRLRFWKKYYGVDIVDLYQDINTPQVISATQNSRVVFISHWPEIALKLKKIYPDIKIVSLYAHEDTEIHWQIKTYIEKVGISRLQNFTFLNDIEQQKNNYINTHGVNEYYRLNVSNMFEIFKERAIHYQTLPGFNLSIARLQHNDWATDLARWLGINIDSAQTTTLFETWNNLHNHYLQNNWLTNNDTQN
jgi:hypothetical protein